MQLLSEVHQVNPYQKNVKTEVIDICYNKQYCHAKLETVNSSNILKNIHFPQTKKK